MAESLAAMGGALLACAFFFLVFAVLGVMLFAGKFASCNDTSVAGVQACVGARARFLGGGWFCCVCLCVCVCVFGGPGRRAGAQARSAPRSPRRPSDHPHTPHTHTINNKAGTFADPAAGGAPAPRVWANADLTFDNVGAGLLTLFVTLTVSDFTAPLQDAMAAPDVEGASCAAREGLLGVGGVAVGREH